MPSDRIYKLLCTRTSFLFLLSFSLLKTNQLLSCCQVIDFKEVMLAHRCLRNAYLFTVFSVSSWNPDILFHYFFSFLPFMVTPKCQVISLISQKHTTYRVFFSSSDFLYHLCTFSVWCLVLHRLIQSFLKVTPETKLVSI